MKKLNREEKAQVIAAVAERMERTGTVVAADFRGLTVAELAELRDRLREAEAEMSVIKNTLSRRAANETGRAALLPYLEGPTGLVWVDGDPARAAKVLSDFAKQHQDVFTVRGGMLDGNDLPAASLQRLASLPSKETLLAQLAGGLAAPLTGLAGGMQALISTLARTLAAVQGSGALAPGTPPAAPDAPAAEAAPAAEEVAAAPADDAVPADAPADAETPADEAVAEAATDAPSAEVETPADEPVVEADAADAEPAADASADPPAEGDDATPES